MTRRRSTIPSLAILLALWAAPACPDDRPVAALVQALGSPDWEAREAAQDALVRLGLAAMPALEEAVRSADLEVACRSGEAWRTIRAALPADEEEFGRIAWLDTNMPKAQAWWRDEAREVVKAAGPGLAARVLLVDSAAGTVRLDAQVPVGLVVLLYRAGSFVATAVVATAREGGSIARVDAGRSLRRVEVGDTAITRDPALRLAALERALEVIEEQREYWPGE